MKLKLAFFSVGLSVSLLNCTQDELIITDSEDSKPSSQRIMAVPSIKTVDFNNRTGAYSDYSQGEADSDFGGSVNTVGGSWDPSNHATVGNSLFRVKLAPMKHSATSGGINGSGHNFDLAVPNGGEYELKFAVRFENGFQFGRGGKIGFGISIGTGNSGGKTPPPDGGSLRFMWKSPAKYDQATNKLINVGGAYFVPYAYYSDQPNQYGDEFGKRSSFDLTTNQWYTLYMRVKTNTNTSTTSPNGAIEMRVGKGSNLTKAQMEELINKPFKWTDTPVNINKLSFNIFRGGNTIDWVTPNTGYIHIDNVSWKKL
ncbi:MAG: hypothetical protein MUF58_10890 [Arcicella sp.]|nr:hypothetical protein [Arcicella sp.]